MPANKLLKVVTNNGWLALIVFIAFILRFYHLNYQSLWLDELHTMNEANPHLKWIEMLRYLKHSDQHPPLYFIIERFAFTLFGYTEFIARLISVIAGTVSVWAMYRLGKDVLNKSLGLICAILTTVNFYNLFYSQEARPYIFAFLFAALSFTYFIKLVKSPSQKTALYYALFTLLLLYSHYYSLFAVCAQVILGLIFIFQEDGRDRKLLFKYFLICFIIISIGYLPCLPLLLSITQIKSFWIQDIPTDFIQRFFYGYFGDTDLLNPLLILLIASFFIRASITSGSITTEKIKSNPVLLSFTIIFTWITAVLLIPYLRSLITVPMLYARYTIVLLPAIILALAYGIELFKTPLLKYLLTALFVCLSLTSLFFVKKYYSSLSKTQFREMTQYLVHENTGNFPIFNESTAWHQQYYLAALSSHAKVYGGNKEANIDSILNKSLKKHSLRSFWIVGAHGTKPDENKLKALDTTYSLLKQKNFYDAWALFYMSKQFINGDYIISYNDFIGGNSAVLSDKHQIAIWSGAISTRPVPLKRGKFKLVIAAMGTPAARIFPHLNIYMNGNKIDNYFVTDKIEERSITVDNDRDTNATFKIELDNDLQIPPNQDRNVFLQYIIIKPIKPGAIPVAPK